ncbi:FkbM family methyltransferase [Methanothermococcus sp. SCGC AD-155-N22]|nr:FkbM family methyltransferase [Methanothermococcus sp. SCGC AD-155-N22]
MFPYALSDKEDNIIIFYDPIHSGGASINNPTSKIKKEIIKTKRLDSFIDKIDPEKVSFIKIDVEGHEYRVLRGADKFLDNLKRETYLMVEILENSENKEKTIKFLKEKGFELIEVDNYTETNYLFCKKKIVLFLQRQFRHSRTLSYTSSFHFPYLYKISSMIEKIIKKFNRDERLLYKL